MIVGIGIDAVETDRFTQWHTYSKKKLARIFSLTEIDYCLSIPIKSTERFAIRFSIREALFKALSQAGYSIPFLSLCKQCTVVMIDGKPQLTLLCNTWHIVPLITITHTKNVAIACVLLQTVR